MISSIPKVALVLALFGVFPFAGGAITSISEEAFNFGMDIFGARFVGPFIPVSYTHLTLPTILRV